MHAKISNSRQESIIWSQRSEKQRIMHFFCNSYRDNISQPHFSSMLDFNIGLYGENLRTEQSVPIDTILKKI